MPPAQRIASLISSATEILYLLDLDARVVGVSHECDYPPQIAGKPRLTRSLIDAAAGSRQIDEQVRALSAEQSALYEIDAAALVPLRPDLIITQAQCDVCAVRYEDVVSVVRSTPELAGADILALNPRSIREVIDDVERVGRAVGEPAVLERARRQQAALWQRVDRRRAAAERLAPEARRRVICLEWIDPPMVAANWMPELVKWAGGDAGLTRAGAHSSYAAWRQIVEYDPQVLVIMPCGFDLNRAMVEARPLATLPDWHGLAAVRQGRVYAVDGNAYFNRSGPRLVDSLEILCHLVHPELAAAPNVPRAWQRMETDGTQLRPAGDPISSPTAR